MKKILFSFLLVSLSAVVANTSRSVFAQSENSIALAISPPTAYLKVQPGGQATHTITLENTGSQPITLQPRLVDFSSDGKTGNPILSPVTSFPFLDIDGTSFQPVTIAPKSKAQLTLRISVPQGAPSKEYPLTVLFENTEPAENSLSAGAGLAASIGSNLIVLITGVDNPDVNLSLESLQISKIHDSFRPIVFSPLVRNRGIAAAVASGSAEIKNWRGTVIASFPIYPSVILAGTSRELLTQLNADQKQDSPLIGPFSFKKPFFFGIYTITLTVTKGETGEEIALSESHKIVALPVLLLLLSSLTVVSIFSYKHYQNRQKSTDLFR